MYILESERLYLSLDENSGLAEITDKKTKTVWRQFYPIPAENQVVFEGGNWDSSLWETDMTVCDGALVASLEYSCCRLNMRRNFPIPGISIFAGNYDVELIMKASAEVEIKAKVEYYTTVLNKTGSFLLATLPLSFEKTDKVYKTVLNAVDIPDCTDGFILDLEISGDAEIKIDNIKVIHRSTEKLPVAIDSVSMDGDAIYLSVYNSAVADSQPIECKISLDGDTVVYDMQAPQDARFDTRITYPPMPHSCNEALRWVIPKDSGILLPSTDLSQEANYKIPFGEFYVVPGLCMAFLGADNGSDGCMMIIDNPLCARVGYTIADMNGMAAYLPHLQFFGDKGEWAENRRVRLRFLEKGNYVDMAKTYREIAREKGYLETYKEKIKRDETFAKSVGTHRIDSGMDYRDMPALCEALYKADAKNVLLKFTASRDNGAYLKGNELFDSGILKEYKEKYSDITLYEYENTRDLYMTAGEFALNKEYADLAKGYRTKSINGDYLCGWIDNTGNAAYILCPHFAKKYLDYRMSVYPLEDHPYYARLYDVLATTSLTEGECYDEEHPCSRHETAEIRKGILEYSREKYRLDVHTEGAAEYLIPYCNTFEGSLSVMNYPGVDFRSEKYEMDLSCRIPLWQLVYHDCAATYMHWEHGGLDHPTIGYDDALVMLYGERGMFLPFYASDPLNTGLIDGMISRIKKLNIVLDRVKNDKMENHSFLTDDGALQKTEFSSGVTVIANLSRDNEYEMEGYRFGPWSVLVKQNDEILYSTEN